MVSAHCVPSLPCFQPLFLTFCFWDGDLERAQPHPFVEVSSDSPPLATSQLFQGVARRTHNEEKDKTEELPQFEPVKELPEGIKCFTSSFKTKNINL